MRIDPLGHFGAQVSGCTLNALDVGDIAEILAALSRNRVMVVRNQTIGDTAFADFLARMGEPMFTTGETPVPGEGRLNIVSNIGRNGPGTTPPRSVFHTDTSYVERPPAVTALMAVTVPREGGATVFSDQVRVAEQLPMTVRSALQGKRIRHAWTAPDGTQQACWHPVLRRHPETGAVSAYLSTPERCDALSDTDRAYGRRAIRALYRRSMRPGVLYRHVWRAGDVVLWDNRTTMHRADHSAVCGDRVLHRGMVRGEIPEAA